MQSGYFFVILLQVKLKEEEKSTRSKLEEKMTRNRKIKINK